MGKFNKIYEIFVNEEIFSLRRYSLNKYSSNDNTGINIFEFNINDWEKIKEANIIKNIPCIYLLENARDNSFYIETTDNFYLKLNSFIGNKLFNKVYVIVSNLFTRNIALALKNESIALFNNSPNNYLVTSQRTENLFLSDSDRLRFNDYWTIQNEIYFLLGFKVFFQGNSNFPGRNYQPNNQINNFKNHQPNNQNNSWLNNQPNNQNNSWLNNQNNNWLDNQINNQNINWNSQQSNQNNSWLNNQNSGWLNNQLNNQNSSWLDNQIPNNQSNNQNSSWLDNQSSNQNSNWSNNQQNSQVNNQSNNQNSSWSNNQPDNQLNSQNNSWSNSQPDNQLNSQNNSWSNSQPDNQLNNQNNSWPNNQPNNQYKNQSNGNNNLQNKEGNPNIKKINIDENSNNNHVKASDNFQNNSPIFYYKMSRLKVVSGGYILLAGSKIYNENWPKSGSIKKVDKVRVDLLLNKQINENGVLRDDYFHHQPSPLAHLVNGQPANGYEVFKTEQGLTLNDYLRKSLKRNRTWY